MRKRVCLDARMIFHSGIGTYLRNLIRGFNREKFFITLIVHPDHAKKLSWLGQFPLIFTNAKIYSLREQIVLPWIIPRCDVFISPHFNVPVLPVRARKRIAVIHDVYHLRHLAEFHFLQRIYAKIMYRLAVYRSNQVITVSNFSRMEIQELLLTKLSKIQVIPLAADHSYFQKRGNSQEKDIFSKPYFLFVGSDKAHKNLKGAMEAFQKFSQANKGSLVIVGVDSKKVAVGVASKRIHFLNFVESDELRSLYQQSCGLIFPSFYEGFGFPPLEAMSSGCPVITSKLASIPEVCGSAVIYVDPSSPKEICQAMNSLVKDETQRNFYVRNGLQQAQKFQWTFAVDQHEKLIERVLCMQK